MTTIDTAPRKPGFPFRRLRADFKYACGINLLCAVVITVLTGSALWENLVASFCIGTLVFLIVDGIRLSVWGEFERPHWSMVLLLVALAVPVAQVAGTALFGWLMQVPVNPLQNFTSANRAGWLMFTLMAAGAGTLLIIVRERITRKVSGLEAAAAQEKARAAIIERQAMQTQLQLLQAQIEPHMLFNTLANLQGLISFDPVRAQLLLDQLIQYLRATLSSSRADATTLVQEFALMEAYLGLMAVRMGARLGYTLDLPDALRQVKLPPMLLQPLVENAIQHGLEPKIDGGHITVRASVDGDMLTLTVADDGLGLDHAGQAKGTHKGTHLGVTNIRERLQVMHGTAASLSLDANTSGGATARLTLPFQPSMITTTP